MSPFRIFRAFRSCSSLLPALCSLLLLAAGCVSSKPTNTADSSAPVSALVKAVRTDDIETIERLLRQNPGQLSTHQGDFHYSLLHEAVNYGAFDSLSFLIEAGAPLEARDILGRTPLHLAARSGRERYTRRLLEAGAEIAAIGAQGETPLHLAVNHELWGTIDLLLEHGAPLNVTDRVGRTPLDVARIQGYRRLEESLRNRRAEPVGVLIATYDWMYDYRLPDRDEFKRLADFRDMWARTAQP